MSAPNAVGLQLPKLPRFNVRQFFKIVIPEALKGAVVGTGTGNRAQAIAAPATRVDADVEDTFQKSVQVTIRYTDDTGYFAPKGMQAPAIRAWVGFGAEGASSSDAIVTLTPKNGAYEGVVTWQVGSAGKSEPALASLHAAFAGPDCKWDSDYSRNYQLL